jgi:thiol-disulfide isomerase/thioredoxin
MKGRSLYMKKWLLAALLIIIVGASIYSVKNYENKLLDKSNKNSSTESNSEISANNEKNSNISQNDSVKTSPILQKSSAIDFKLKDLEGKEVSLSQFKGKKVFLNFWATWCPPCKQEMPEIEKVFNETKDSDLVILTVNLGENQNTVKAFMDKNNYHFKVVLDLDEKVATKYNIQSIPTSLFIDKDGNVVSTKNGAMTKAQMDAYIKSIEKK